MTSLRFSHDASTLATAGQDQTVRLYRVGSWEEIACLREHDATITAIDWSPDDRRLVSGGRDHEVLIWDVNTGQVVHRLEGHTDAVRHVAWSPDGKWVASCAKDSEVRLWDTNSGLLRSAMPGQDDSMLRLAFSSDGRWLACGGYAVALILYDVSAAKVVARHEALGQIWSPVPCREWSVINGLGFRRNACACWMLRYGPLRPMDRTSLNVTYRAIRHGGFSPAVRRYSVVPCTRPMGCTWPPRRHEGGCR